jgi:hypothetical protein
VEGTLITTYCDINSKRLSTATEPATEPLASEVDETAPHPEKPATPVEEPPVPPAEQPAPVVDEVPPVEAPTTEEPAPSHTDAPAS